MELPRIPIDDFQVRCHLLWDTGWLLLTAGDLSAGRFNMMTVSWGSFGTIWNRPFAQVVVRPSRHTFEYMEAYDTFTLCALPEACRPILEYLGARSGRDVDKVRESGLTPVPSLVVAAPGFAEADLIVECRKIYRDDLDPAHFLDPAIASHYPQDDYHRVYFGEVLAVRGTGAYRAE
ncbi:MAG TPA: flavin reductase [Candidatus Krumholzibacteria bacterium]|nr:flavin reductase [Candidatus Krumholzibacteria bacterium]HPD71919.1 flavin reductase [Candidatus Krumholzibacteria bacterium]HRY41148.1 flavin reductase [Candidatus Krumholzibacteria bacterium]